MADPWDEPEPAAPAAPAAAPAGNPWDEPAPAQAGPQGGLMQTIPQGIEMMGSEEGRAKLWEGVKKFPGDFAQGLVDFVTLPGRGFAEGGVSQDEQIGWAFNAALGTIGGKTKFPRAATEAIAPHVAEFDAGVTQPVAEQVASEAATTAIDTGEHPQAIADIVQAKQSGLIGPEITPPPDEAPAVSAQRAIPASAQQGDKITMTPAGEPIDAWQQRFNDYVDKTETPDDFKALIKDMAAQNNNFPEARAGSVAPEMVQKVAEAAGMDAADINAGKLRTTFRTDDEIRTVTTLLKKLGDDVQSAAELVRSNDSPENLAQFQAAMIKRDYAFEASLSHTVALRAEWGRSGNALKEILSAQNDQAALTNVIARTRVAASTISGTSPEG